MKRRAFLAVLLGALTCGALSITAQTGSSQWALDWSALTYHMSHPMHQVEGTSNAAKGKGICQASQCNFLIAVPVKTFSSGDSNRDLHMIEATKGAEFPMIVVRAQFAESELDASTIHANLQVQFAGQTAHYQQVPFQRTQKGSEVQITGTIPLTCSDFKIERPSFLGVPIKNEIPVRVQMNWHKL
ncbi:MAG: YceI family protein [Acidobacteriota bacterium]